MGLKEIIKKYIIAESYIIEIEEGELKAEELEREEVPTNMRIILYSRRNKRKRIMDLSILKIIYERCSKEFVRDYLNLSFSLLDIHKKYKVFNELEFLAICGKYNDLHEDLVNILNKLRKIIEKREKINRVKS
ncbi:MAG: hypothetical protein QXV69_01705 [Sulfolobaceae archaeon]